VCVCNLGTDDVFCRLPGAVDRQYRYDDAQLIGVSRRPMDWDAQAGLASLERRGVCVFI
jgi:hypothetical protein